MAPGPSDAPGHQPHQRIFADVFAAGAGPVPVQRLDTGNLCLARAARGPVRTLQLEEPLIGPKELADTVEPSSSVARKMTRPVRLDSAASRIRISTAIEPIELAPPLRPARTDRLKSSALRCSPGPA